MPLTPHGSPGDFLGGLSGRTAFMLGAIMLLAGLLVASVGQQLHDGLMLAGFGLAMLGWAGLQSQDKHPRLFLALGVIGGLVAFGAALAVLTTA